MAKKKKVDLDLKKIILEHVGYKGNNAVLGQTNIDLQDSVEIVNVLNGNIILRFSRKIATSNNLFDILVSYLIEVAFTKESIELLENNMEKLMEFINKMKVNIVNDFAIPSRASVIISSLTSNTGVTPLITPPAVVENEQNDKN